MYELKLFSWDLQNKDIHQYKGDTNARNFLKTCFSHAKLRRLKQRNLQNCVIYLYLDMWIEIYYINKIINKNYNFLQFFFDPVLKQAIYQLVVYLLKIIKCFYDFILTKSSVTFVFWKVNMNTVRCQSNVIKVDNRLINKFNQKFYYIWMSPHLISLLKYLLFKQEEHSVISLYDAVHKVCPTVPFSGPDIKFYK